MLLDIRKYPMSQLGDAARAWAIDIANALLSIGVEESKTLRIAIASAQHMELGSKMPLIDEDV
ncbi:MAG: hypothetical protein V4858_00235 [Pseudomonadota bacterium]